MADDVNDSVSNGSSESAPPDFQGTFGAFEHTRATDERAINRILGQAAVYQFPAIEGYTPYDDPHADQYLVDRHLPRFLDVRSPDACRAMEHKLKREESEAELVCSSGWVGAVAAAGTGRPALATWTPGRPEYVNGELRYRPGHAALSYGFPDIDPAQFGAEDSGSGVGGGGDEDTRDEFYEGYYAKPGEKHPILRIIVRPRWVKLPEREGPDGNGKSDTAPKQFRLHPDEKSAVVPDNEAEPPTAQKPDGETEPSFTLPHIDLPRIERPKQPAANLPQERFENPISATKGAPSSGNPSDANERRAISSQHPASEVAAENVTAPHGIAAPDALENLKGQEPRPLAGPVAPEQAPDAQATSRSAQPTSERPPSKGNSNRLGWVDQFKLSQTAAEYSSIEGAGRLYKLATVAKWLEENPEASDTDLLTEFAPGLLRIRWAERRQAMVDYFRSAPTLLEDVRQKQADYEAMESSGSFGDFTAWLAGQAIGGWKSPETYAGGSSKAASLLGRALWTGLKQAGIAAGSDAVVQWLLIKAGFQKEFNPVQTLTTAVTAGAFNAAGKASVDGVKLGISSKSGQPRGKAPAAEAPKSAEVPQSGKNPAQPIFADEATPNRQPLTLSGEFLSGPAQTKLLQRLVPDYAKEAAKVKKLLGSSDWNVPPPLVMAIRHYTGDIYKKLNKALREDKITHDHEMLAAMIVEGLGRARKYQGEIWRAPETIAGEAEKLWQAAAKRGADFDLGYQFQSFTIDKTIAARWSKDAKLIVHIRNPRSGAYIADFSHVPSQQEVLLPPGLKYKVINRREEHVRGSPVRVIELEIVDVK